MKKLIIFVLLFTALYSSAQNYQENLEKYWFFRHRLKTEFMLQTDNSSIQGSNQIAENYYHYNPQSPVNDYLRWADGIWWQGQYISVLAMEYRLLKNNDQDYNGTLNELNLALNAYDRLDLTVGDCFEEGYDLWDGFYLRDDVIQSDEFIEHFPTVDYVVSDYLNSCGNGKNDNVTSQDANIQMFMGLMLAKQLVDDSWIQQKVTWIADALIERMHHSDDLGMEVWEVLNYFMHPAEPPAGCNVFELLHYKWALAEAAGRITGDNEHTFTSQIAKPQWDLNQNIILQQYPSNNTNFDLSTKQDTVITIHYNDDKKDKDFWSPFQGYMTATLSVLSDDPGAGENNVYDWLIRFYQDTYGYLTMPNDIGLYPHLILISEILNGYHGTNRMNIDEIESKFLNTCPPCGSFRYYDFNSSLIRRSSEPWHTMSLSCPQNDGSGADMEGDYNMIDYMLLYNSYFLNYMPLPYFFDEDTYPNSEYEIHWDINGYPDTIWFSQYDCIQPKIITSTKQIDSKATILQDGGVEYTAGNKILFLPGFIANNGCCLTAQINSKLVDYHETNVNTCNGTTFTKLITKNNQNNIDNKLTENNYKASLINSDLQLAISPEKQCSDLISIYPNPTYSKVTIRISNWGHINKFEILNNMSKKLIYGKINQDITTIDMSTFKNGIYYLRLYNNNNITTKKIVKL